jgi:hypothetical protein
LVTPAACPSKGASSSPLAESRKKSSSSRSAAVNQLHRGISPNEMRHPIELLCIKTSFSGSSPR